MSAKKVIQGRIKNGFLKFFSEMVTFETKLYIMQLLKKKIPHTWIDGEFSQFCHERIKRIFQEFLCVSCF